LESRTNSDNMMLAFEIIWTSNTRHFS